MADNNWKKLTTIGMSFMFVNVTLLIEPVVTIGKDILRAHRQLGIAGDELETLQETLSEDDQAKWAHEAKKAQSKRLKNIAKVSAMDIYNSNLDAGEFSLLNMGQFDMDITSAPSRVQAELDLYGDEQTSGEGQGITRWITMGLTIQEQQ